MLAFGSLWFSTYRGLGSLGIPQATMSGTFSGSPYTPPTSESILDIGFNNTANIHSKSNTNKMGGKIRWIKESQ